MEMNLEIAEAARLHRGSSIGIQDELGEDIRDGDRVELQIRENNANEIIVLRGRIEYRQCKLTYGCGYAIIRDNGQIYFLTGIKRCKENKLFIIREEQ